MRILIINVTTDLYGSNRILALAMQSFPARCRLCLLLPSLQGPLIPFLRENNPRVEIRLCKTLPIIQRKMFTFWGAARLLRLLFHFHSFLKKENRKEKIDLVYINTLSNIFVLPVAKWLKLKTHSHVHEILETPKIVSRFINKNTVKWSDSVVMVSEAVKQNLLRYSPGALGSKIHVVHNGIPDLFAPQYYAQRNTDKCIITLISRIKPEKGIWYFMEALSLLENKRSVLVRIIGGAAPYGDHYVEKLKRDIEAFDVPIEYLPFLPDVRKELNETDIIVVPSIIRDSFPTTVLEGMSCQKVVITTDNGGATEAIQDRHNGRIIPKDDVREFARVLDQMIQDEEGRKVLGKNARERFLRDFCLRVYKHEMRNHFSERVLRIRNWE